MSRNIMIPNMYEPTIKVVKTSNGFGFRLKFNKQNDSQSPVIRFTRSELMNQQSKLKLLLEEFQEKIESCRKNRISYVKDIEVVSSLKRFAEYAFEAYEYFRNGIEKSSAKLLNLWESEFELANSWQNKITEKYLNIVFPIGTSFPFGLYFLKNPKSINWDIKQVDIKEVMSNFLDSKAYIINDFQTDEILDGKPINIPNTPLKLSRKSPIRIIHCIDDDLNTESEIKSWEYDEFKKPVGYVRTIAEFESQLIPNNFPQIVHFSSHFDFSENENLYKLTLTKPDFVTKGDIRRLKKLEENQSPALFFINACDSGISIIGEEIGFIEVLYPEFSLGFITTLFNINDKVAGLFANKFYKNFFNGRKLIESLYQAKRELIQNDALYSVIGYTIWQVDPELKYFGEDYIKNRTINKKKIKNEVS